MPEKPPVFKGRAKMRPKSDAFFLRYQTRWIKDDSRVKIMQKARQIGISWSTAYRLVRAASEAGAQYDFWVSSRDDIQAKLFIEDCKKFCGIFKIAAEDLGVRIVDDKGNTASVIQFANGRRIHSMSSNADAQAGKRGSRCLDEFALHPDPRRLYAIAYPGITWGGGMEIISTHRGTQNYFNTLVQETLSGKRKFSLHTVTLEDALADGFLHKLQCKLPEGSEMLEYDEAEYFDKIRSDCPDEETFNQEYMCRPADDASAFLSYELISGCCYNFSEDWELSLETLKLSLSDLYLGVDVGRKKDLTVLWLFEKTAGVYFTRAVVELRNAKFSRQRDVIYSHLSLPNLRRACFDSTGIGAQLAEEAKDKFGGKVEEVLFTNAVKSDLAYPVKRAFEDKTLRIPRNKFIEADLRSIKKTTTASGNERFDADRSENGHADRFWALALGIHAGAQTAASGASAIVCKRNKRWI